MLCPASDNYFAFVNINKSYGIPNHVAPCSGICTDQYCVIFSFLHFMNHERLWLINHLTLTIKILIIKRNKFKKYIIINCEVHPQGILPVLVGKKTFTGKISFYVGDGFA